MVGDVRRSSKLLVAAVGILGLAATSCGSDTNATAPTAALTSAAATTADAGTTATVSGTVTVLAASSLTESFNEIAGAFSTEHPDAKVNLSFGASSELVT